MKVTMDTPSTESTTAPLNQNTAAEAFSQLLTPQVIEKSSKELEAEAIEELTAKPEPEGEPEQVIEAEQDDQGTQKVTIEVDGKTIELTKAELADAYKNGLRQADYTQKTMAVAEAKKSADAEKFQAQQERQAYAVSLQKQAMQLEGALESQSKIDWNELLNNDPVEYLKQQHLYNQRQAAYQQTMQQGQQLQAQDEAEKAYYQQSYVQDQRDQLLAKLPEWKDEARASAEKIALKGYLVKQGFDSKRIDKVDDHLTILIGRKAMLYDQMMSKAQAASKKVQALPQKMVRPGVADSNGNSDGRNAAMQRLSNSGRVEDAAELFKQFL